jgi:hypothetical protein
MVDLMEGKWLLMEVEHQEEEGVTEELHQREAVVAVSGGVEVDLYLHPEEEVLHQLESQEVLPGGLHLDEALLQLVVLALLHHQLRHMMATALRGMGLATAQAMTPHMMNPMVKAIPLGKKLHTMITAVQDQALLQHTTHTQLELVMITVKTGQAVKQLLPQLEVPPEARLDPTHTHALPTPPTKNSCQFILPVQCLAVV